MNRSHALAGCVVALAAAAGLAACSSSGGQASTPTSGVRTSTAGSTATATTTVTASATGSPVSSTPTSASSTRSGSACAESQLRASVAGLNVGLDNYHVVKLTFANISSSTCTLTGYPGAAIEDSSNRQVQQATRTIGGPVGGTIERVATISLRPGASAYAYLAGKSTREVGAAQAGCDGPKYPRILVTPPNTDTPVPFTIGWPLCYQFTVHPVRTD